MGRKNFFHSFVVNITYEGNLAPFLPLLRAGETMHVGKGTSFGLGKFSLGEKSFVS
jgi:CRISPR/Cas system endoribonuclease Cas6 (RAMP superfamily)